MTLRKNSNRQKLKKWNITEFPGQPPKKTGQQKENHVPQGDLIADLSHKLSFIEQVFKNLPVKDIIHFKTIKDFRLSTRSAYPIVIIFKDSGHCHCIDGWNLVQQASNENKKAIKCHIFYMDSYDVAAVGIFKLALRSMPLGGTCSHAEMILNIRICFRLIAGGTQIPKPLGHGGDRKGSKYDNNLNQKIIELLAAHLGKTKRKIREYINHGNELSDEILEFLVKVGATRRFFEAIQKNKNNVIAMLKQEEVNPGSILKQISCCTKEWYAEHKKTGEIADELKKEVLSDEETQQIPDEIVMPSKKSAKVHKHWVKKTVSEEDLPPTKDQIYAELSIVIGPILQLKGDQPDITEDIIQQVLGTSKQLLVLSESMSHQLEMNQMQSEREKVA